MKAVEAALADRIMGKLGGYPEGGPLPPYYGYPYYGPMTGYPLPYYPYDAETAGAVAAVNNMHGALMKYEYDNAIAGMVAPSVDGVAHILRTITDPSGMAGKAAEGDAEEPAAEAFIQTEGIPVLVDPVLMENEEADSDLEMRNFVIDGVNGFDLTQMGEIDNSPEDQVEIQTEGVPVLVHPESMLLPDVHQMGAADMTIFPAGSIVIGADEVYAVQTGDDVPEEATVLQMTDGTMLEVKGI